MRKQEFSDLTEYPKVYKDSPWGGCPIKGNHAEDSVIENRNNFVPNFGVKKYISNDAPNQCLGIFDHCELYKTEKGYVYLISPYGLDMDITAERFGFSKSKPMYSTTASTFILEFPNKVEFNRFMRSSEELSKKIRSENE